MSRTDFGLFPTPRRTSSMCFKTAIEANVFMIKENGERQLLEYTDFKDDDILSIGHGQQGTVYPALVMFKNNLGVDEERLCVLKRMKYNRAGCPFITHETITRSCNSTLDSNVVKLIQLIRHNDETLALLPFCELFLSNIFDSLFELAKTDSTLYEYLILHMMTDLLCATAHIHHTRYTHGDIKPDNIAYYNGRWCLIDLDCAISMDSPKKDVRHTGTLAFTHPACFKDNGFFTTPCHDLYGLGTVLELLLQKKSITAIQNNQHSFYETVQDNVALYNDALSKHEARKKNAQQAGCGAPLSLSKALELEPPSLLEKLSCIAQFMTHPVPEQQPTLQELINIFKKLQTEFLNLMPDLDKKREQFYNQNIEAIIANKKELDPLTPLIQLELQSRRESSSAGLSSTNQRTPSSIDECDWEHSLLLYSTYSAPPSPS